MSDHLIVVHFTSDDFDVVKDLQNIICQVAVYMVDNVEVNHTESL